MTSAHLKPGWRMVKFGDIAENIAVRVSPAVADTDVYVGLEHLEPETLHLRRWGHPTDVEGDKLRFWKGDVIFARRRAYQRKLALAEFDGICSAHAMVIRAKPKMILPEFLPFFLQSDMFMERAVEISVGSLSPTINWTTLCIQEFPLPPIEEQKRFAEILHACSESQERKFAVLTNAIALRSRIVNEIANSLNPRQSSKDWRTGNLKEVFEQRKEKGASHLETLSVTIYGEIVPRNSLNRNVEDRTGPEKCFKVKPGDIAYNTMRMWQGACGLANSPGVISPAYTVITCKSKDQLPSFWLQVFRSKWMKKSFERFSTGIASDRWRLYFKDFSLIKVKIPPLDFQLKVVDELRLLDEAIRSAEIAFSDSKQLLMGFLNEKTGK